MNNCEKCGTEKHEYFDSDLDVCIKCDFSEIENPEKGTEIFNIDDDKMYIFDGVEWLVYDKDLFEEKDLKLNR